VRLTRSGRADPRADRAGLVTKECKPKLRALPVRTGASTGAYGGLERPAKVVQRRLGQASIVMTGATTALAAAH
jgi:hypothetical protein